MSVPQRSALGTRTQSVCRSGRLGISGSLRREDLGLGLRLFWRKEEDGGLIPYGEQRGKSGRAGRGSASCGAVLVKGLMEREEGEAGDRGFQNCKAEVLLPLSLSHPLTPSPQGTGTPL